MNRSAAASMREQAACWFTRLNGAGRTIDDATLSAWRAWMEAAPGHASEYAAFEALWRDFDVTPRVEALAQALHRQRRARRRAIVQGALGMAGLGVLGLLTRRGWEAWQDGSRLTLGPASGAITARGFTISKYQFDGVPVSSGNVGIETSNTVLYDRVEVLRGATGLLTRTGDATVNLVRKRPRLADGKTFTGKIGLELGSWDHRAATADLSVAMNADASVRARLVAHTNQHDAFIDPLDGTSVLPSIATWDGSFAEPPMGDRYGWEKEINTQTAIYAATRLQVSDRVKLILGSRVTRWRRDIFNEGARTDRYKENDVVTPYAGVVADLSDQWSVYASYTDIFKPQTLRDRNGDFLDPLIGKNYETGLKGELLDGRLQASAAVFRIQQDNYGTRDEGFLVPGTTVQAYQATKGVTAKGYELEVTGMLAPGWNLSAGWTHLSARDAHGADVQKQHPRKQLKVFTSYRVPGTG